MGEIARRSALLVLALLVSACQTFNVRTDWDPAKDFDVYQRYLWVEPPEVEGASPFADNTLLRKRVRYAIERELASREFLPVESADEADFAVTYSVILEERLRVNGVSSLGGGLYRNRYVGFGSIYSTTSVRNYQESTLIIDFLDPSNDDLVWRGWGTGIVRTKDRDRGHERLARGVKALIDAFPPGEDGDGAL